MKPSGGFGPPERFRIINIVYSSIGVLFLAILPFAMFGGPWADNMVWRVLGLIVTVYCLAGLFSFPFTALKLRRGYPELFPSYLVLFQLIVHFSSLCFGIVLLFGLTEYPLNAYTMSLVLLLAHGSTAYIRTLLYRRDQETLK